MSDLCDTTTFAFSSIFNLTSYPYNDPTEDCPPDIGTAIGWIIYVIYLLFTDRPRLLYEMKQLLIESLYMMGAAVILVFVLFGIPIIVEEQHAKIVLLAKIREIGYWEAVKLRYWSRDRVELVESVEV
jgi:hypothetical protein